MLEKSRGIVLHSLRYGETSLISHIFTEKHGRRSFMIKGARSKNNKQKANLIQPLFILDLEYYFKESRDLLVVREFNRSLPLGFLNDPLKNAQVFLLAEILYRSLHTAEADPEMFQFLVNSIEYFDLREGNTSNFHLSFLLKLTRYLGITPPSRSGEGIFEGGSFGARENSPPDFPERKEQELLFEFFSRNYDHSLDIQLSRNGRNRLLEFILRYYSTHHYPMENLRSWSVLKEIFDT